MEIPEGVIIPESVTRAISEKQEGMISEKSTPEKLAISGKLKELILERKTKRKRPRQEESPGVIRKRQNIFHFFWEDDDDDDDDDEEEDEEDEEYGEDPRDHEEARRICAVIDKYVSSGEDEDEKIERLIWQMIWKHEENKKKRIERKIFAGIKKFQQLVLSGGEITDEEREKGKRRQKMLSKLRKKNTQKVKLSKEEKEKVKEKKEKDKVIWEEIRKRQKELFFVLDEEEQTKGENEIYEFLWNHEKQYLSEEEKEKKIKERQTYLEMRQKAKEDPNVPFALFGPGCVVPKFEENYEGWVELRQKMEEERGIKREIRANLPSLPPLPWDNRRTVPLTPEFAQQFEQQQQLARRATVSPVVISKEEKREKLAAQGRCLTGSYLTPFCKCDDTSRSCVGFKPTYPQDLAPIWLAYRRQIRQSHCFDIDDHPVSAFDAAVGPLAPYRDFSGQPELLMELANRAIREYNEKECNVFKYKLLKIEKVNGLVTGYYQYWMTLKVLNLTLGTPIETFQVHAGKSVVNDEDKVIYCCRPKEEVIVGLPICELCFGLLHREEEASSSIVV